MTSTLSLDGYIASIEIDFETGQLHGEVVNTRDVLTFSGNTPAELQQAFSDTLADYRKWCEEEGVSPEKPYSGTLTLRMPALLHQAAARQAAIHQLSLTQWIVQKIECELGERPASITREELALRVGENVREEMVRVLSRKTVIGPSDAEISEWAVFNPLTHDTRVIQ